jgi:hypothetical protein
VLTFPFSVLVTDVGDRVERLLGESIQRGDTLTGRFVLDVTSISADLTAAPTQGNYHIFRGHVEFDVQSELTLPATSARPIFASVVNNHANAAGNLFDAFSLAARSNAAVFDVAFELGWTDPGAQAFSSDLFPTDPAVLSRFRLSNLRLQVQNEPRLFVVGRTSQPAPVPEPATWLLVSSGVACLLARRRRHDRSVRI